MTKYEKGAGFERKIATILRRKGYFVTRSAGSFSIADLTALKKGQKPLLIQCKAGTAIVKAEDRDNLFLTAEKSGAIAITACKEDYKPIVFTRLTGFTVHQGGKGMIIRESDF